MIVRVNVYRQNSGVFSGLTVRCDFLKKKEYIIVEKIGYILALSLGWPEILLILVVALLIFGRRLPQVARSLGKSLTEFKKGLNEVKDTHDELANDVKKVGDDVVKETKDAAGLNDSDKAV